MDNEEFQRERKKYASASQIMKNKVVIKEGSQGTRARHLRTHGEELSAYKKENEEMVDEWDKINIPNEAFHKVDNETYQKQTEKSEGELKTDLENLKKDHKTAIKTMAVNIIVTALFILLTFGLCVGILKLDELVFINFDQIYIVYAGYFLINAGLPILVFRILRILEKAALDKYIRIWHQIFYIIASLAVSFLMIGYMSSAIGLAVAGVSLLAVILLTFFPKYEG